MSTYSGPGAAQGDQLDKGAKLYLKLNSDKLPKGVKVELVIRDDTGANPDIAKRIAQRLQERGCVVDIVDVMAAPPASTALRLAYVPVP